MDVMIFVLVNLLILADIMCALPFQVEPLEIGTLGTIPCDQVENDPEIRIVQWFKSRRIDTFEGGDSSLAQWADGVTESQLNYHMDNTTFSLVIKKATLGDEGLYKCSVESGDVYTQSIYYTRTVMYALPQKDPEVTLDLTLNRVNCTVEHVKPLIYPEFNFDYSHASTETYAVLKEDGTYTTSVSSALPQTNSAPRVDCSISYLHYQGLGSLELRGITTESLIENKLTTMSPLVPSVTSGGDGCKTIDHSGLVVWKIVLALPAALYRLLFLDGKSASLIVFIMLIMIHLYHSK